ncbi:MAG: transglutaminase domain-containing protein [Bacteroidota bacterium]
MSRKVRKIIASVMVLLLLQNLLLPAFVIGDDPGVVESGQDPVEARLARYGAKLDQLPPAIQQRYEEFVRNARGEGDGTERVSTAFSGTMAGSRAMSVQTMAAPAMESFVFPLADRGDAPPDEADLALAGLTAATPLLHRQADLLGKDPVRIYNFLRQSIRHHPYLGAARDAEAVLREGAGNDLDQATLCLALLRLAGIPCRYASGEVSASAGSVRAWLGVNTTEAALRLLGEAGIAASLTQESFGQAIRFRHYWVRAYLSYLPQRGAAPGLEGEEIWLDLDPSWKRLQPSPVPNLGRDLGLDGGALMAKLRTGAKINTDSVAEIPAAEIRKTLDQWTPAVTEYAAGAGLGADRLAGIPKIDAQPSTVLPASLPFIVSARQTWSMLPAAMAAMLSFGVDGSACHINLSELENGALTLSYRPATPDDATVFDVYRDEAEFPAFLVRLCPVLSTDGQEIWTGPAVAMGREQTVSLILSACGKERRGEMRVVAGSLTALLPRLPGQGLLGFEEQLSHLKARTEAEGSQSTSALLAGLACAWDLEAGQLLSVAAAQAGLYTHEDYGAIGAGLGLTVEDLGGLPFTAKADKTLLMRPIARRMLSPGDSARASGRLAEVWPGLLDVAAAESALKGAFGLPGVSALELLARANDLKAPAYGVTAVNLDTILAKLAPEYATTIESALREAVGGGRTAIIPGQALALSSWRGGAVQTIGPGLQNSSLVLPERAAAVAPTEGVLASDLVSGLSVARKESFTASKVHLLRQFPRIAAGLAMTYLPSLILAGDWLGEADPDLPTSVSTAIALGATGTQYVEGIQVIGARGYPSLISPNGDGLDDAVTVFAGLSQEADWILVWKDITGAVKRSYSGRGASVTQEWDGRDGAGNVLPDGEYQFALTAMRGEARSCETGTVIVDTTPPRVEIAKPAAGTVSGPISVFGRADDLHFSAWAAEYGMGEAPSAWTRIASGSLPAIDNSLCHWDTRNAANGAYTLRVWALDRAGNRAEARVGVTVANPIPDTVAPTVEILSPLPVTVNGIIPLRIATADDRRVARLEIYADNDTVRVVLDPPPVYEYDWDTITVTDLCQIVFKGGVRAQSIGFKTIRWK